VKRILPAVFAAITLAACNKLPAPTPQIVYVPVPTQPLQMVDETKSRVRLYGTSGSYRLIAHVNDSYSVAFVLDTGADSVLISLPLATELVRNGTLTEADMGEGTEVQTASGQIEAGLHVRLRSVEVGGVRVNNVHALVMENVPKFGMLLGQSFLRRLPSWSIDNQTGELVIAR
jgi:aspartyl protease family protein